MKFDAILLIAAVGLFAAAPVFAQSMGPPRPERPSRAMFGSGGSDKEPVLSVLGTLGTGYDTNPSDSGEELLGPITGASPYTQFGGQLEYAHTGERLGLGASVLSGGRYYPSLDQTLTTSYGSSLGASFNLSARTRLQGTQAVTRQSARAFVPFAPLTDPGLGEVIAPDVDFRGSAANYTSYRTSASISHDLSRRSSVLGSYARESSHHELGGAFNTQSGSLRFTQRMSRDLSLRLGYGLTEIRYRTDGLTYRVHNIDSGLDFSRDLSLTRRTRLAFTSGATAMKEGEGMRYEVIGSANLTHEIGRSWNALAAYNRNFGYNDALRVPYLADNLSVGIGGQINRRVRHQSGVGASFGDFAAANPDGTEAGDSGFFTWFANSTLQFALTRNLAISADYTFYRYDVDRAIFLTPGFAPTLGRHSARVSLNVFKPLVERRRSTDATR